MPNIITTAISTESTDISLGEYLKDVVRCDWCNENVERKNAKFWHTGARICPSCYSKGEEKDRKFREEFKQEMSKGSFSAGW